MLKGYRKGEGAQFLFVAVLLIYVYIWYLCVKRANKTSYGFDLSTAYIGSSSNETLFGDLNSRAGKEPSSYEVCPKHWPRLANVSASFRSVDSGMFVYSAYFDNRDKDNVVVRVVAVADYKTQQEPPYCILWFDEKECQVVRSIVKRICGAGTFM